MYREMHWENWYQIHSSNSLTQFEIRPSLRFSGNCIQGVLRKFSQALKKPGSYHDDEINGTCLTGMLSNSNLFLILFN